MPNSYMKNVRLMDTVSLPHADSWTYFNQQSLGNLEVFTGVLPTVQHDNDWTRDVLRKGPRKLGNN